MKTESIKALLDACYQAKRIRDGRPRHLSFDYGEGRGIIADLQRVFLCAAHAAAGRRFRRGRGLRDPHD